MLRDSLLSARTGFRPDRPPEAPTYDDERGYRTIYEQPSEILIPAGPAHRQNQSPSCLSPNRLCALAWECLETWLHSAVSRGTAIGGLVGARRSPPAHNRPSAPCTRQHRERRATDPAPPPAASRSRTLARWPGERAGLLPLGDGWAIARPRSPVKRCRTGL